MLKPVKLADDVKQRKQNSWNNSVQRNNTLQNKGNLLRFLHRGKALLAVLFICQFLTRKTLGKMLNLCIHLGVSELTEGSECKKLIFLQFLRRSYHNYRCKIHIRGRKETDYNTFILKTRVLKAVFPLMWHCRRH